MQPPRRSSSAIIRQEAERVRGIPGGLYENREGPYAADFDAPWAGWEHLFPELTAITLEGTNGNGISPAGWVWGTRNAKTAAEAAFWEFQHSLQRLSLRADRYNSIERLRKRA